MAGVSACVCAAALCHSSAACRPHPLWAMCHKFIFASSVSSPHSTQTSRMQTLTDNTEAHEPKLTWLHKRLYLNSSQTQLKITDLKTEIVFPKQWHVRAGFSCRQICSNSFMGTITNGCFLIISELSKKKKKKLYACKMCYKMWGKTSLTNFT